MKSPLIVGHMVNPGWFRPNPDNGCLDHVYDQNQRKGGHCTCRIGRLVQDGIRFYLGQNSWGNRWAWNGCFLMDEEMDARTAVDIPYAIDIPGGFERLRDCEGWKAGLIKSPSDYNQ